MFPFVLQKSSNITLRNFTIDFSFPRYVNGELLAVSAGGMDVRILDGDLDFATNEAGNLCFTAGGDVFSTGEKRFFLQEYGGPCCYLTAGEFFYANENLPAPVWYCDACREGDVVHFRRNGRTDFVPGFHAGARLAVSYDENRLNDVVFLDNCRDITVADVTIWRGAGMGIVGQCCENLTVERLVIEPAPGRGDLYSTTADGLLLTNFTGTVRLTDCRIAHTMDDAMSVHGFYTNVETITAPDKAILRLVHPSQSHTNPYSPGDTVTFSDGTTMAETGTAVIRSARFERAPDLLYVTFVEPVNHKLFPGDWVENKTKMPAVEIRGCTFDTFPSLRLGSPKKILFEDNTVTHGQVLVNDLLGYWCASGCVADLTIRRNRFVYSGITVMQSRKAGCGVYHSGIVVRDNRFEHCHPALQAGYTRDLTWVGNRLTDSSGPRLDDTCSEIHMEP